MSNFSCPRAKFSRRALIDLGHFSGVKSVESKYKAGSLPGQHSQKRRVSDYGNQLKMKQAIRRSYGVSERQFLNYYKRACKRKGVTGQLLLNYLESRLDNLVYMAGFASTRKEARQMVSHGCVTVDGKKVNIPSFLVSTGAEIVIKHKQERVLFAMDLYEQRPIKPDWIDVYKDKLSCVFKRYPDRSELPAWYQEDLVVEFYSK